MPEPATVGYIEIRAMEDAKKASCQYDLPQYVYGLSQELQKRYDAAFKLAWNKMLPRSS